MKFWSIFKNLTGILPWLRIPFLRDGDWGPLNQLCGHSPEMEMVLVCVSVCGLPDYFLGQRGFDLFSEASKHISIDGGTHSSLRRDMVGNVSVSLHFLTKCSAWRGISHMPLPIPTRTVTPTATGWTKTFVFSLAYKWSLFPLVLLTTIKYILGLNRRQAVTKFKLGEGVENKHIIWSDIRYFLDLIPIVSTRASIYEATRHRTVNTCSMKFTTQSEITLMSTPGGKYVCIVCTTRDTIIFGLS